MSPTPQDARPARRLVELLDQLQRERDAPASLVERFQREYAGATAATRSAFFDAIVRELEIRREELEPRLRAVAEAPSGAEDPVAWSRRLTELRRGLESPRMRAFRRFLNVSGGLEFLLDLRADVLDARRSARGTLDPLDEEIAHLIDTWFHHGFLFLQEIDRRSPFWQIRYLQEHELVHPSTSLEEMARRLGGDRRCFALFHRAMPEEPVVFIEVALTRGLARSIHEIIPEDGRPPARTQTPDTAIFYSINNTQNGLSGLGIGRVLISQVVGAIRRDEPGIRTFATLSPIPGFWRRYLRPILREGDTRFALRRDAALEHFPAALRTRLEERHRALGGELGAGFPDTLAALLDDPRWIDDEECRRLLEGPLTALAWRYIDAEKDAAGRPLNPVARFHLGNGARASERNVNFAANRSARGLAESCGLMANYVYSLTWLQRIGRRMRSLLPSG